ncbi:MAG: NUDIX domain-containing protein [Candidatus Diapherotrites archaeon]|uniref:NUDIX domain-containing protein n=1 Tax=Candidatus Iainarchaeum sp. TaxID=3101447 RepID=A0A7J4KSL8_9ARCH|nr:NUDIX domain-containing protein [Candidatus Diapherotrites archaeon]HIH21373.1 NUDIX domain-containing protein [Candidatus Diapherotrites archaeon]HIH32694.1 NUDIX domain-containing protein [Candidatus Diapherotrites archaeon]
MSGKIPKRKGVCAVVFRNRKGKTEFLLLYRVLHWKGWEFPKGGVDGKETALKALQRELMEETSISEFKSVKSLNARLEFYDRFRRRVFSGKAFLVEFFPDSKVSIAENKVKEHSSFRWVPKKKVLKTLTYKTWEKVFRKALKFL